MLIEPNIQEFWLSADTPSDESKGGFQANLLYP